VARTRRLYLLVAAVLVAVATAGALTVTSSAATGLSGRIVFTSNRSGNFDIWVMNADGSGLQQLTTTRGGDRIPAWSPDGSQIAFMKASFNPDLYVMNANGTNVRRLTDAVDEDCCPDWSPDGSKIVFHSRRSNQQFDIYVMNADGSNERVLASHPAYDGTATWSPDGTKIVFRTTRFNGNDIAVMNADGSNVHRITTGGRLNRVPQWSPVDDRILFVSNRTGNDEIYVVNADGTGLRQLTFTPSREDEPEWSPDGTKILFSSTRDGNEELYVMNADGSSPIRLTNHPAVDMLGAWWGGTTPSPTISPSPTRSPSPSPIGDTAPPDAAIDTPTVGQVLTETPIRVEGSATDDVGVAQVRVAIRDRSTLLWYDGVGWRQTFAQIAATLGAPGATRTHWSFRWSPPTGGTGAYAANVQAVDTAGKTDPTQAWASFSIASG
jgi:Tol biopolymer transport system component